MGLPQEEWDVAVVVPDESRTLAFLIEVTETLNSIMWTKISYDMTLENINNFITSGAGVLLLLGGQTIEKKKCAL